MVFCIDDNIKDHVTMMTRVMAAEIPALPSKKCYIWNQNRQQLFQIVIWNLQFTIFTVCLIR